MQHRFEESDYFKPYQPIQLSASKLNLPPEPKRAIWDKLYDNGLAKKKVVEYRHKNKIQKLDQECTFNPKLRSKSNHCFGFNKFAFLERNNIWQENKRLRIVKQQQQELEKEFKECTFTPIIKKYKRTKKGNDSLIMEGSNVKQTPTKENPSRARSPARRVQFQEVRWMIWKELQKIRL